MKGRRGAAVREAGFYIAMLQSGGFALYSRTLQPSIGALTMAHPLPPRALAVLLARLALFAVAAAAVAAPAPAGNPAIPEDKFRQLEEILPTPNGFRTASGAPGPQYWQQRVDYEMDIELDDVAQVLKGREKIRYTNNSPDPLAYLWLQLDQNLLAPDSPGAQSEEAPDFDKLPYRSLARLLYLEKFSGGMTVSRVEDAAGKKLAHTVVKTMMRIDLEKPLLARPELRLRGRLVVPDQRRDHRAHPQRLRVFPQGRQLPLRDGAVLPAPRRLHRRHRLAAQTVPRPWRVHPRVRQLQGAHHRAGRPRGGRQRACCRIRSRC